MKSGRGAALHGALSDLCLLKDVGKLVKRDPSHVLRHVGFRFRRGVYCRWKGAEGREAFRFDQIQKVVLPFPVAQRIAAAHNVHVEYTSLYPSIPSIEIRSKVPLEKQRQPVIVFLGHFDHGKTTLLEALLKSKSRIQQRESHGITQEIRAAHLALAANRSVTVLDTPGQDIFSRMRANGSGLADLCVLLVSAQDGVLSQTEESIAYASELQLPVVVALNKVDLVSSKEALKQVQRQLRQYPHLKQSPVVPISAKTGFGLGTLRDTLCTVLSNTPIESATENAALETFGTVVDVIRSPHAGNQLLVLLHSGSLRASEYFVCRRFYGRIRSLHDPLTGNGIKKAFGGMAVRLQCSLNVAYDDIPLGESLFIVKKKAAERIMQQHALQKTLEEARIPLDQCPSSPIDLLLSDPAEEDGIVEDGIDEYSIEEKAASIALSDNVVPLLVKCDRGNTLAAIQDAILERNEELDEGATRFQFVSQGVGSIGMNDVVEANGLECPVFGYNVAIDAKAKAFAKRNRVRVLVHTSVQQTLAAMEDWRSPPASDDESDCLAADEV